MADPNPGAQRKPYNINVPELTKLAHVGVRRSALFMGLGLNAAHREDFNDYELHKIPIVPGQTGLPMDFFPPGLPAARVKEFKTEFAMWIIACGFRELLEHYALFLDQMHKYCLVVFHSRGKLGPLDPKEAQMEFNRRFGIPKKLDTLKARFSVAPTDSDSIKQLYEARNCLTHDLGIVRQRRCDNDGQFTLTWKAMDVVAQGENSRVERPAIELIGNTTDEPTMIGVRMVSRERKFALGSKLALSQQDLWEICYFFKQHAIPSATESFLVFLQANDVAANAPASSSQQGTANT